MMKEEMQHHQRPQTLEILYLASKSLLYIHHLPAARASISPFRYIFIFFIQRTAATSFSCMKTLPSRPSSLHRQLPSHCLWWWQLACGERWRMPQSLKQSWWPTTTSSSELLTRNFWLPSACLRSRSSQSPSPHSFSLPWYVWDGSVWLCG